MSYYQRDSFTTEEAAKSRLQNYIFNVSNGMIRSHLAGRIVNEVNLNLRYIIVLLDTEQDAREFLETNITREFHTLAGKQQLKEFKSESTRILMGSVKPTITDVRIVDGITKSKLKRHQDEGKISPFVAVKHVQTYTTEPINQDGVKLEEYFNYYLGIYI